MHTLEPQLLTSALRSPLTPITHLPLFLPLGPIFISRPHQGQTAPLPWFPLLGHYPHQPQIFCVISTRRPCSMPKSFTDMASWVLRDPARIPPPWPFHLLGPSWSPFLHCLLQSCPTQGFVLASLLLLPLPREANVPPPQSALLLHP